MKASWNVVQGYLRQVGIKPWELVALFGISTLSIFAESVSMGMLYPAMLYIEKGPEQYLDYLPGAFEWFIGWLQAAGLETSLLALLIIAYIPLAGRHVISYLAAVYSTRLVQRGQHRLRVNLFRSISRARLSFHKKYSSAKFHSTMISESMNAASIVVKVNDVLCAAAQLVVVSGLMLVISPRLSPALLPVSLVVFALYRIYSSVGGQLGQRQLQTNVSVKRRAFETLRNIRLVKIRGAEDAAIRSFDRELALLRDVGVRIATYRAGIETGVVLLFSTFALTLFYLAVTLVGVELATLGVFMLVMMRLQPALTQAGVGYFSLAASRKSWDVIRDLIDEGECEREFGEGRQQFTGIQDGMELRHVSVSYHEKGIEHEVLRDVSLCIQATEMVALVGPSGAGKSTLADVMTRFTVPSEGEVLFDGVPAAAFDLTSLRCGIGFVPQEPIMFDESVRDNLTYGLSREVADEELRDVLRRAHCDDFVPVDGDGLSMLVGESGVRLSGGERQRLALARALLDRPSIMILDEPTSALDPISERPIQATLAELKGTMCIVVIAHKFSTVEKADRFVVMEAGRIVGSGRGEDLAKDNTLFGRLFVADMAEGMV